VATDGGADDGGLPGNCGGVCVPNAAQCSDGGVETCGSNGQWGSAVACTSSQTCSAGTCIATPIAIAAGSESACALLLDGTIACWGENEYGELGNGTTTSSTTPVAVSGLTGATAISVGNASACALLSGGTVQCWGDNEFGELGNGSSTGPDSCIIILNVGEGCATTPVAVTGLAGATAISVGYESACALLSGGTVECWGDNGEGELGNGTTTSSTTPVAVTGLADATAISVGVESACAVLSGGTVKCWGWNGDGQLGNDTMTNSTTPVAVSGLTGATAISVGGDSACAILSGGTVQCWGDNGLGGLGNGATTSSTTPVAVTGLTDATAISVGATPCALLSGRTVQCWGDNEFGQLGNGTTTGPDTCSTSYPCSTTPVAVTGLTGATTISVGGDSACAILSEGTVQCWGDDAEGQLGNGTTTNSSTPVPVTW
jgi:alpha-tubulin suppressor-like RCC1 family protein